MFIRKVITILFVLILAGTVLFYAGKEFILERFKLYLIEKVNSSTLKAITIKNISYAPLKGIGLAGVTLYKDKSYKEKEFYIPNLYIKFSPVKFLIHRIFSVSVSLDNLKLRHTTLDGSFGFSATLVKQIKKASDAFESIKSIRFSNFSVKTTLLNITNINGTAYVSTESVKMPELRFKLNGEPCVLDLEIAQPLGELTSTLKISSSKFNLTSHIKKEDEIYKISELKGGFLNSPFEFMGEFSARGGENKKAPLLSLYGKADINIEDIAYFALPEFKESLKVLNPQGTLTNSVYFKGNLKDISACELGIKSVADYLKIWNFKFDKFHMDARLKDGVLHVPLLSAYPYNGTFISSAKLNLMDKLMPYQVSARLSKVGIAELLKDTRLGMKNVSGRLFSELMIKGNAKSTDSMQGKGNIFINEANLGPMPLLTPLVGNLYGYFQGVFPGLKRIDITKGSCDFHIANRRISTNNLVLWGDVVSVHAKGYMDFDKNLNFEIENRFLEPEKAGLSEWEETLQEMISRFGKLMSKAYLTGTLDKPKWKFEYLSGIQNVLKEQLGKVIKGELGKVLKGIFE